MMYPVSSIYEAIKMTEFKMFGLSRNISKTSLNKPLLKKLQLTLYHVNDYIPIPQSPESHSPLLCVVYIAFSK